MTAAKIMDIISKLPGCDGTSSRRSIGLYPSKNGRCSHNCWKFPKSEWSDIWIRLPRHIWPKSMVQYGRPSRSSWKESVRSSFGRTIMGKSNLRKSFCRTWLGENPNWECLFVHLEKGFFFSVYVGEIKLATKNQKSWSDVEITQQRSWFGRTNIFPGSCALGMFSKTMWNKQKILVGQLHRNFRGWD